MIYARDLFGDIIEASPGGRGECPTCGAKVIAKCGSIKIWHWSHERSADCDQWSEGESEWHRGWKRGIPPDRQEVVIGPHRADVIGARGVVIELQNSPISIEEIHEREQFYGNMIWLFNAKRFAKNFIFRTRKMREDGWDGDFLRDENGNIRYEEPWVEIRPGVKYRSFRWKHPRRSILACRKPVFLDIGQIKGFSGSQIFEIEKSYDKIPCGGWGRMFEINNFFDQYFMD